jgi:phage terminase large subunit
MAYYEFPPKLQMLWRPSRYKVAKGGRGSAKSWSIARALLLKGKKRKLLIVCAREYQKSIAESVHRLLQQQIIKMNLTHFYRVTDTHITGKNGTEFIFVGLHTNIKSIKSMEGADILWIEEAENISKASWKVIIPTIRKPGSEIWVSYNPDDEKDPTHVMFGGPPDSWPPGTQVVEINWQDNKWLPEELRIEKDYAYKIDPDTAEHVWGGKCNVRSDAQILKGRWKVEAFEPDEKHWDGPYFGQDFGFSTDPAATTKSWINDNKLYIEHAVFGHGLKNKELNELIRTIPGAGSHIIRADCARPETIAHLAEDFDLNIVPCTKWPGCVEDRIQYFRSFEQIIIHPEDDKHPMMKHMIDEARLWKWKVDRLTGDILPIVVDKWNHGWDATGYGHEPAILRIHEEQGVVDMAAEVQISQELEEAEAQFSNW